MLFYDIRYKYHVDKNHYCRCNCLKKGRSVELDEIDFKLLGLLLEDGRMTYKELAKRVSIDERLASRRLERMVRDGVINGFTADVDWSKLGYGTQLWIGTSTAVGVELREKLFKFIDKNSNIVQALSSVGAHEYVFYVICSSLEEFRSSIGVPLEPLTAGLHSSVITSSIKAHDLKPLLEMVKERTLRQSGANKRG